MEDEVTGKKQRLESAERTGTLHLLVGLHLGTSILARNGEEVTRTNDLSLVSTWSHFYVLILCGRGPPFFSFFLHSKGLDCA